MSEHTKGKLQHKHRDFLTLPMPELKPCPICGGEAKLFRSFATRVRNGPLPGVRCVVFQASCKACGTSGPQRDTFTHGDDAEQLSVHAWNARTRERAKLLEALNAARLEMWRLLDAKGIDPEAIRSWPEIVQIDAAIADAERGES